MDYSPLYALITLIVFLGISVFIVYRFYIHNKRKEHMYRDLISLQEGVVFLLNPENLVCMTIYPSKESEQYHRFFGKGVDFTHVVAEEFQDIFKSTAEKTKATNSVQEIVFRLRNTTEEEKCWVKLNMRLVNWSKGTSVFACVMKKQDEMVRLQSLEQEIIRQQKNWQVTAFDMLWRLDIETRQLELLNDLVEERHLVPSRPAGKYELRDLIMSSDFSILEEEINYRVRYFLEHGEDLYAKESRIINIRLRSTQSSGVWYGACGVIDKDDYGRLVMYGTAHRLPVPAISKISEFEISHLFVVLMNSPALRVFWSDLEGTILGCNKGFALDMGENSPETLQNKNIEELEYLRKEWVTYFYKHLKNFKEFSPNNPISKYFHVTRDLDHLEVLGQFNVMPLLNENGKAYGGLFMYWVQPAAEVSRDHLSF